MTAVLMLLVLCAVGSLSILLAGRTRCTPAAAPAVVLCAGMVWMSLAGCAGLLQAGGWVFFAAAAASLGLEIKNKGRGLRRALQSPGFVLFMAGSVFFILLFAVRRPMFYQWDDFTFWGSAAKTTFEHQELYSTAPSNMVTRAYPPGLPVLVYLFEFFFSEFAEWGAYAAYDILALACMAAVCSGEDKASRPKNILLLGCCVLLPLFFEVGAASGVASAVYLTLQADLTLGLLWGGAVCLYFASAKTAGDLMQVLVMLAGLSLVKDMGLALGLVAAMVIAADLLFCAGAGRRWPVRLGRAAGWFGVLGAVVAAGWLGWSVYVGRVSGQDRFDLGNAGDTESLGMAQMMIQGVKELLGIGRTQEFSAMGSAMTDAFFHRQVCLLGSGLVASTLVLAVLAAAFVLGDKLHRRRVAVYTLFSLCGFAAFWVFHWFLYLYVFKAMEGQELKDYSRYFLGWYMGWMLGALGLLGTAGGQRKRPWAGLCAGGLFCLLGAVILWRGQTVNNFTTYSATFYDERLQVKERAAAVNAVLEESDRVYPICQGNDGTRWYYYGYELDCELVQMYGGGYGTEADPYQPTTAVTLTDETTLGDRQYEVVADAEGLLGYLKACGATVLLVDRSDPWLAGLLQPYTKGQMENSALDAPALYRISWQGDEPVFTEIPLENTLLGAWASQNDAAASAGGSEVAAP